MNKAQKLLQPLIEVSIEGLDRDALMDAFNALATLADAITLADVPAVDDFDVNGWVIANHVPIHFTGDAATARRYVEIRIHLAALERKLLAELAGT